jgi:hypothetical protein
MRNLFLSIIAFLLLSSIAFADQICGKTFVYENCKITFQQGPFGGPGESGTATVDCGTGDMAYPFIFSDHILDINDIRFVMIRGSLYFIDSSGIVMTEEK